MKQTVKSREMFNQLQQKFGSHKFNQFQIGR